LDPLTLIVTALAAGAASALQDTTSSTAREAYGTLRALVVRRLAGSAQGELLFGRYERDPARWEPALAAELAAISADSDLDLLAAAQAFMTLAAEADSDASRYTVDLRGVQGVQIGDHNTQSNVFDEPEPGEGSRGLGGDQRGD
jgi:hypothetical protein